MVTSFRHIATAGLALFLALPTLANGQDINLATGGADQIWKGTQPNAKAGFWLDLGDMTGDGRTIAKANYARYYGQVGNGGVASSINPVGPTTLRYPWVDANRNLVADVGEVVLSANPLIASTNWSAANPANTTSANSGVRTLRTSPGSPGSACCGSASSFCPSHRTPSIRTHVRTAVKECTCHPLR